MNSKFQNLHGVVVGLGSIGNRHLNNLLSLGVGRMTVVRRAGSQNTHFTPPENVATKHELSEVLSLNPDFVVVCNPTHLHATTAIQSLEAGAHVLIEKPLGRCVSADEQRLVEIAQGSGGVCAMAYCMRFHQAYRLAFDQTKSGAIGRCLYAKAWFEGYLPDWHPWEDYKTSYAGSRQQGGGVLRTLDHELDFMNWVLGPAESATGSALNTGSIGIEADDLAMYLLHHPGNVVSQITTSFFRKPQSRGYEFVGENGTLTFRMEEGRVIQALHGHEAKVILDLTDYDINSMYVDLVRTFLEDLTNNELNSASVASGIDSLTSISQIDNDIKLPVSQ